MGLFNRDRCEGKTPEQLAGMRTAGLLVGRTLELLVAVVRPGHDDPRPRHARRDPHPRPRRHPQLPARPRLPPHAVHLGQRGDRARHPGLARARTRATCSRSTAAPRSASGTATPPSASSSAVPRPPAPRTSRSSRTPRPALWAGIAALRVGESLYAVGAAVEDSLTEAGERRGREYGIVEDYVGHGIGTSMHMDPQVPNYRVSGKGPKVVDGTTICIEPMVALGDQDNIVLDDEWTVATRDRSRAAHWEHSVAATTAGLCVLTAVDGGEARLRDARRRRSPRSTPPDATPGAPTRPAARPAVPLALRRCARSLADHPPTTPTRVERPGPATGSCRQRREGSTMTDASVADGDHGPGGRLPGAGPRGLAATRRRRAQQGPRRGRPPRRPGGGAGPAPPPRGRPRGRRALPARGPRPRRARRDALHPGTGPARRDVPWDVRQLHDDPDAARSRAAVLDDLEHGVTSVWVHVGDDGVAVADLPEVLADVRLDLAPVVVSSVTDQPAAAPRPARRRR